jgi:hypothetical protein
MSSVHSLPENLDEQPMRAPTAARTKPDNVATTTVYGDFTGPNRRLLEKIDTIHVTMASSSPSSRAHSKATTSASCSTTSPSSPSLTCSSRTFSFVSVMAKLTAFLWSAIAYIVFTTGTFQNNVSFQNNGLVEDSGALDHSRGVFEAITPRSRPFDVRITLDQRIKLANARSFFDVNVNTDVHIHVHVHQQQRPVAYHTCTSRGGAAHDLRDSHRDHFSSTSPFGCLPLVHAKGWSCTRSSRFTSCLAAERHRPHTSTSRGRTAAFSPRFTSCRELLPIKSSL